MSWTHHEDANFAPRGLHDAAVVNDTIVVIGGTGAFRGVTTVATSTDGVHWTETEAPFGVVTGGRLAVLGSELFLVHGAAVWKTSNGTDWTQVTVFEGFPSRTEHELVAHDGEL